ncbi:acyltransferase family protein [Marinicellulosiphila megalodicopiae]|uniref:acyltransferase family protein n=1 Tax=Marinicellulosiphila megalodicopiae TaxID=2724896 RepID=UPI003BB07238
MNKLIGFDGVRAIACLMIILHHISQRMNPMHTPDWLAPFIELGFQSNIGVSMFFVLSGALLSYPFWKAHINQTQMPKTGVYFLRRFARIAPGFYLSLTATFVLSFMVFDSTLDTQLIVRYISGLLFLNEFHYVTLFPADVNGPLWSIGFEVFSYVLLFLVMLGLFRFLKNRPFTDALYYLLFIFCLTIMIHVCIYKFMPIINEGRGWQHGLTGGALIWMPGYNPMSLFSHFFFGIVASALLVYLIDKKQTSDKGFDYFILFNWFAFVIYVYFQRYDTFLNIPYYWPFFPMLIGITLICLPFTKHAARILDNRFFAFTAKISFGLYVWHFLIIELIQTFLYESYGVFETEHLSVFFMASTLTVIFSYIIATLSFYLIERPVQKWSQSFN